MGVNTSHLRNSEVEGWSPEDVASFLGTLDGEEFETAMLLCVQRGINGQEKMICQLAGDSVMCNPYLENMGLRSRESRYTLRQGLQNIADNPAPPIVKGSPGLQELNTNVGNHTCPKGLRITNGGYSNGYSSVNDLLGGPIERPSHALNALQCAITEDEVSSVLAALSVAFDMEGLEMGHKAWVEAGTCQHICIALQQNLKSPTVQVIGLRTIAVICNECQIARIELGNACSACSFPSLAVTNNPSLPEVAAIACQAAALLVNDITPHFSINIKTACLQNINRLVEGGMCETLEVVFKLVSSLKRAVKDDSFPNNFSAPKGGEYSLLESACLCSLYMSTIGGKVRDVMVKSEVIINGLILALKLARKKELQRLSVLSARVIANLTSDHEDCAALGPKMQICVEATQLMGAMFWHEDTVEACGMALANICRCNPSSSLHITGAHGCAAFSRVLEAMKNSQKTVQLLLLSISTLLDTSMPELQEQMGISKIGQYIVSAMLAHKDVTIIQQAGCRVLMLLARGHIENQKRLGLSGSCEAVVEAMKRFPEEQEIQEQGSEALLYLSQYVLNAPNLCALGAVKIILKSLECPEEFTSFSRVATALGTIRNMSCEGPASARAVANEGVLKVALNLINKVMIGGSSAESKSMDLSVYQPASPNGEAILQGACQVISEIANVPVVSVEYCKFRGSKTMVEALAWLQGRPNSLIAECLKTIVYLTYDSPEAKRRVVTSGISQAIIKAMQRSNVIENEEEAGAGADEHSSQDYACDPNVVYYAMLCISTVAWELEEEYSQKLYDIVPLCIACLSSQAVLDDRNALERTCITVDYLAAGKPNLQKMFHSAGVISMLVKVLETSTITSHEVESCVLSAICSVCDGSPEACSSFYDANGLSLIMTSSDRGSNMKDSIYFLSSALLRTLEDNYEQLTPLVVSGVSELGQLRGREGIADDAFTTLSAICNSPSELRLACFVDMDGLVHVFAAFMKNPDSSELAILATDTLTRYFNTRIGSLWLSHLCNVPPPSTLSSRNKNFFELQVYVQALDQALNLVETDYVVNIMRLLKDLCERGGLFARRIVMDIKVYDSMCMALKPSLFERTGEDSTAFMMLPVTENGISPVIVELFEMFLNVVLALCCNVDETDPNQTGSKGFQDSSEVVEDITSVIIDSSCAEKAYAILTVASSGESIRTLERRLLHNIISSKASPQVLVCQEMWSGVAVACLSSAASFGSGDEVSDACETLRAYAHGRVQWRDTLLTKGLAESLTKAVLCHKYHLASVRSICLLTSEFCGSPPSPQYARDFSGVGQALCESMAYWSDQVNEYDESVIGSTKWVAALDVLKVAATAISCLSCNFNTNKLLVAAGAVEMVCDTITSKQFADREYLPSSLIICLTNLLGNLFAWPGNKGTNYELASLTNAARLLSEWEQKLGDDEKDEEISGGNEEERIVYCHFIQTICTANPSLIEIIVKGGAPAALSVILHSCTLSLSPSVACEAFVAIRSICHPNAYNLSEEGLLTAWKSIVSALNACVLDSSTVEEGLLAMNAVVLKYELDSELLLLDLRTIILLFLDTYSDVETVIEAALVLMANVSQILRAKDETRELSIPGLAKRMALAATKFRFNDCIIDAVKGCL